MNGTTNGIKPNLIRNLAGIETFASLEVGFSLISLELEVGFSLSSYKNKAVKYKR